MTQKGREKKKKKLPYLQTSSDSSFHLLVLIKSGNPALDVAKKGFIFTSTVLCVYNNAHRSKTFEYLGLCSLPLEKS